MIYQNLIERLPKSLDTYPLIQDNNHNINNIKWLTQGQDHFDPDTLYFGALKTWCYLPPLSSFINLVLYTDQADIIAPLDGLMKDDHNILIVRSVSDPYAIYNLLQDYFLEDQETSMKMKRLLTALVSNNGIDHLIDEAYAIFNNPVFLIDTSYRYISKRIGQERIQKGSAYERIMEEETKLGSITEEGVEFIRSHHISDTVRESVYPEALYLDVFESNALILPIRVHGIEVAYMMVLDVFRPFTLVDQECFYRLSFLIAQELQKNDFYKQNKGTMYGYFLTDLLKSTSPSRHTIKRRLTMLQYEPKAYFYLCVIQADEDKQDSKRLNVLISQLQGVLTGHIYAAYEDQLIILFNLDQAMGLSDYVVDQLNHIAGANQLNIGLSNAFEDLADIEHYYHQARKALSCSQKLMPEIFQLHHYKHFAHFDLFDIVSKQRPLMSFCDPDLLRLIQHDEENGSDLAKTLYTYLEASANAKSTSEVLFIHKNTLHYRLDKIRTLMNNHLDQGDDLMRYHLSFQILRYLGLFTS